MEVVSLRIVVPSRKRVYKDVGPGKDVNLPGSAVESATFVHNGKAESMRVEADLAYATTLDVIAETETKKMPWELGKLTGSRQETASVPSLRLDLAFLLLTLAAPGQTTVNSETLEKQQQAQALSTRVTILLSNFAASWIAAYPDGAPFTMQNHQAARDAAAPKYQKWKGVLRGEEEGVGGGAVKR
jgi:hypothetical protein